MRNDSYQTAQESLAEQLKAMAEAQMAALKAGKSLDEVQRIKIRTENVIDAELV